METGFISSETELEMMYDTFLHIRNNREHPSMDSMFSDSDSIVTLKEASRRVNFFYDHLENQAVKNKWSDKINTMNAFVEDECKMFM